VTEVTPQQIIVKNLGVTTPPASATASTSTVPPTPTAPTAAAATPSSSTVPSPPNPVPPGQSTSEPVPTRPAAMREVVISSVFPARSYAPPPPVVTVLPADLPLIEQPGLDARMAAQATIGPIPQAPEPSPGAVPTGSPPGAGSPPAAASGPTIPPPVAPAGIPVTLSAVTQRFSAPIQILMRAESEQPVSTNAQTPIPPGADLPPEAGVRSAPGQTFVQPDVSTVMHGATLPGQGSPVAALRSLVGSFARMESALASIPNETADVAMTTVRSILSFVGRLDPKNIRALPEQIAAFVSHVIEGPEPKLAALARSEQTIGEQARSVERNVAVTHDLKTALATIITRTTTPGPVVAAASEALNAITTTQLGTLASNAANPTAISFAIPLSLMSGTAVAQLAISRDGKQSREPLDAENFHIAFVLETKNLGVLAIDMQTVGRKVQVAVKTERESFAQAVSKSLATLRDRLEMLSYQVTKAAASVAARVTPTPQPRGEAQPKGATSLIDVQA
ncbi:MAG: flagellar hook-length control protein FliK, partial [Vulcanimicrobiaceae bacterium]